MCGWVYSILFSTMMLHVAWCVCACVACVYACVCVCACVHVGACQCLYMHAVLVQMCGILDQEFFAIIPLAYSTSICKLHALFYTNSKSSLLRGICVTFVHLLLALHSYETLAKPLRPVRMAHINNIHIKYSLDFTFVHDHAVRDFVFVLILLFCIITMELTLWKQYICSIAYSNLCIAFCLSVSHQRWFIFSNCNTFAYLVYTRQASNITNKYTWLETLTVRYDVPHRYSVVQLFSAEFVFVELSVFSNRYCLQGCVYPPCQPHWKCVNTVCLHMAGTSM